MFAVVETGGKQYRVQVGQTVDVEKLEAEPNAQVVLDRVLVLKNGDQVRVGQPLVEGAKVFAKVVRQDRAPKILVFKYKAKKNYRRRYGHRQPFTRLIIEKIEG